MAAEGESTGGARWGERMGWAGSVVASGGGNPHHTGHFSYVGELGGMDAVEGGRWWRGGGGGVWVW
jgi:hypothetical protein